MPEAQVRSVMAALERAAERVIIKVTLDVTSNLIEANPVDTGWSRANWIPSVGSPTKDPAGSKQAVSTAAQAAGLARMRTYDLHRDGKVFITNNVPYIVRLNEGSSRQAPKGFVQRGIRKAVNEDLKTLRF